MIKIVKEIESGLISIRTACFKYGLCRNTLKLFITKFSIRTLGDEFSNQIFSRMNDDQKAFISIGTSFGRTWDKYGPGSAI